jgi:pimeloyl-ACP methyl ester carboxylesterase
VSARRSTIALGDRTATYRESGTGIPAVVTAGLGLTSRFYEDSYDAFREAGIRLVVPDLPGWGGTPGPATGLSPADMASFLLEVADALELERPVWIGHSLGAQAVVRVAADAPARAAGIVLVGPTGAGGRLELLRQAGGLAVEAGRTSLSVIGAVAREYASTSPVRTLGTWLRHGGDDVVGLLPRVQCPALVLVGESDPVVRERFVEQLADGLRDVRVLRVTDGTHALPRGHAEAFNGAVTAFVRAVGSI